MPKEQATQLQQAAEAFYVRTSRRTRYITTLVQQKYFAAS
jgi:hypothetical protein